MRTEGSCGQGGRVVSGCVCMCMRVFGGGFNQSVSRQARLLLLGRAAFHRPSVGGRAELGLGSGCSKSAREAGVRVTVCVK